MARSYIKIYGPPILKALKALEKVAFEMGKKTTMKFYSTLVPSPSLLDVYGTRIPGQIGAGTGLQVFANQILTEIDIPAEEKVKLVSNAGDMLGEYDFFFEWGTDPSKAQVQELIGLLDDALADCGCRYTIVTK